MNSQYNEVNGHPLFTYEWANNGEAVALLHGGLSQSTHYFPYLLPAVENNFHVFAYDRTAHGFSGDREGSLHFDYQKAEAIAYLESVVKEPAHLIGYSDGAIISLLVAIERPDLVKSIVSIGGNYHFTGNVPGVEFVVDIDPEDQAEYNTTSPDAPETLTLKTERMFKIWQSEPEMNTFELAQISCPVLVMAGDDDLISHHHTIELFEALPDSQLAIIPGASHSVAKDKTEYIQLLIRDFLAGVISSQPE